MRPILALATLFAAPAFGMQANFALLGDLPNGEFESFAFATNADGSVVVGQSFGGQGREAFRWTAGEGMLGLGFLPNGTLSLAIDVSANGQVIAGTGTDNLGASEAFLWTAGTGMVGLGSLPGAVPSSTARAISPDGSAVVGRSAGPLTSEAFLWTAADGMQSLGTLPGGGLTSTACDVSARGEHVVGNCWTDAQGLANPVAFLWTPATGMRELGMTDTGLVTQFATLVTPDGSQVFGYTQDGSREVPFRWTATTGAIELGTGQPNFFSGVPVSASADGQTVAFRDFATVGNPVERVGLLVPGSGEIRSIAYYLTQAGSTAHQPFDLWRAWVSLDGETLVGFSYFATTGLLQSEAWLATLEPVTPATLGTTYCAPQVVNSSGLAASLGGIGFPQVDWNYLRLEAAGMPTGQFGYYLASTTQGFTQQPGNSQGNLCLGGAVARYTTAPFTTGVTGMVDMTLDLAAIPAPNGAIAVQPGETWNFQAWFRDANPTATSNFTTGLSVTFQ